MKCYDVIEGIILSELLTGDEAVVSNKEEDAHKLCDDARYWEQPARNAYMGRFGNHFNRTSATLAISKLVNRDGSSHCWTGEQVESALKAQGVRLTDKTRWDACYVANMLYSDYFDGDLVTEAHIIKMTAYKIGDPDAKDGDIYTEWEAKMMNHCVKLDYSKLI